MTQITPILLNDTLKLIQLARETARVQGQDAQAERLSPLVDNLRSLVSEAREPKSTAPVSDLMAQDDFKTLLKVVQSNSGSVEQPAQSVSSSNITDRSQIVNAMAAGGMTELEIARQMGMTRDEVQLILSVQNKRNITFK
jgi:hypothetical protein